MSTSKHSLPAYRGPAAKTADPEGTPPCASMSAMANPVTTNSAATWYKTSALGMAGRKTSARTMARGTRENIVWTGTPSDAPNASANP